jgi:hypothetical protein
MNQKIRTHLAAYCEKNGLGTSDDDIRVMLLNKSRFPLHEDRLYSSCLKNTVNGGIEGCEKYKLNLRSVHHAFYYFKVVDIDGLLIGFTLENCDTVYLPNEAVVTNYERIFFNNYIDLTTVCECEARQIITYRYIPQYKNIAIISKDDTDFCHWLVENLSELGNRSFRGDWFDYNGCMYIRIAYDYDIMRWSKFDEIIETNYVKENPKDFQYLIDNVKNLLTNESKN